MARTYSTGVWNVSTTPRFYITINGELMVNLKRKLRGPAGLLIYTLYDLRSYISFNLQWELSLVMLQW
jgi:hypothetical protein